MEIIFILILEADSKTKSDITAKSPIRIAVALMVIIWVNICEITSPLTIVVIKTFRLISIDIRIMVIFLEAGSINSNSQVPTRFFAVT